MGDGLLNDIYEESKVKPDLIRKINFGPFVHKEDAGLDNRQAAYECLDTILDECIDTVDPIVFVEHLAHGLGDELDVKIICQQLLLKASDLMKAAVIAGLESICAALAKTIKTKLRSDAVPTEAQQFDDCVKSTLRCVVRLTKLDDEAAPLKELVTAILGDERYKDKYAQAVEEFGQEHGGMLV